MKIAVIDSGVTKELAQSLSIEKTYHVLEEQQTYFVVEEEPVDNIGHGSSVMSIIRSYSHSAEMISYRLYETEMKVSEQKLIYILEYLSNTDTDIINISAGITYISDYSGLREVCQRIKDKGIHIVSAFDNDGAISYPAALCSVIGVDVDRKIKEIKKVDSAIEIINYKVPARFYRTTWGNRRTIIQGTSFACAEITGRIAAGEEIASYSERKKKLFEETFDIKRIILFPYNKETDVILRFSKLVQCKIVGVYDDVRSGKVGKVIHGLKIQDYRKIDWELDFDTLVLSCTSRLHELTGIQYENKLIELAIKYKKKVYCFEQPGIHSDHVLYPDPGKLEIPIQNSGKLHKILTPTVAIFGTSSAQGKFSLQLKIIQELRRRGYDTGFLSTEPSGKLFGADRIFHYGFHAKVPFSIYEMSAIANELIWEIASRECDIIVTGGQSNIVPYDLNRIDDFSFIQQAFAMGIMPDYILLCINPQDEYEYINRSINYLKSLDGAVIKGLVLYPLKTEVNPVGLPGLPEYISEGDFTKIKWLWEERFGIPVYNTDQDVAQIVDQIEEYYQ